MSLIEDNTESQHYETRPADRVPWRVKIGRSIFLLAIRPPTRYNCFMNMKL